MSPRDEQRERVIGALTGHLLRTGLSQSSLRQLAAAAEVSDRMLLYYFVDKAEVLAILPHGTGVVTVVEGGLEIPTDEGTGVTVIANCCAIVRLDI